MRIAGSRPQVGFQPFSTFRTRPWRSPAEVLRQASAAVSQWRRRLQYRRELRRLLILGSHLVEDIGLMPVQARREAEKPFWLS